MKKLVYQSAAVGLVLVANFIAITAATVDHVVVAVVFLVVALWSWAESWKC
jgi:hypothetical protein